MTEYHISVLLQEAIEQLQVTPGKLFIDGTLGGGGHTIRILDAGGKVLGLDVDDEALEHVKESFKFQISDLKLKIVKGNFRHIDSFALETGFNQVDGILLDLGVSSHQ